MQDGQHFGWIDIAKAAAIVLIVAFHTTDWFLYAVLPDASDAGVTFWREVNSALIPVRIPLFFLVSGILATRAIERPWRSIIEGRFLVLLWPFFIWTALVAPFWAFRVSYDEPTALAPTALATLAFGGAHYWYLPALVVAIALARLTRRIRVPTLVVAAVLAFGGKAMFAPLLAPLGSVFATNIDRWLTFTFWFLLGCFARPALLAIARWPVWAGLATVGVFGGLTLLQRTIGVLPITTTALTVTGMLAAVILSRWASRSEAVERLGHYLARRTLPIYLGHALLFEALAVVAEAIRRNGMQLPAELVPSGLLVVPLIVIVAVAVSAGLYDSSRRAHFGWLYEPPQWLRAAIAVLPGSAPPGHSQPSSRGRPAAAPE